LFPYICHSKIFETKKLFMKKIILGSLIMATIFSSCKKDPSPSSSNTTPGVSTLNCTSATFSAVAFPGVAYSGTASVPYTGGNALTYPAGTAISSTGVTGLTATLVAGTLANGNGNATYTIAGTPSAAGTASFAISLGGQNCSINLTIAVPYPYSGKWAYQYIRDSIYNWNEAINNGNLLLDSTRTTDVRTSVGYFLFNNDNTYKWQTTTATTSYTGTFTAVNNTGYGYGTTLNCLGISTQPAPNDTTRLYIYGLSGQNMVVNRDYFYTVNTGTTDTILIDRYYDLLKQ
jgi:hypothetical protein